MQESEGQQHVRAGVLDGLDVNMSPSDFKL